MSARVPIPALLRGVIIERYGRVCQYCGSSSSSVFEGPGGAPWHVDHVVPVAAGGTNEETNLTLACQQCNMQKHDTVGIDSWTPHKPTERISVFRNARRATNAANAIRWHERRSDHPRWEAVSGFLYCKPHVLRDAMAAVAVRPDIMPREVISCDLAWALVAHITGFSLEELAMLPEAV